MRKMLSILVLMVLVVPLVVVPRAVAGPKETGEQIADNIIEGAKDVVGLALLAVMAVSIVLLGIFIFKTATGQKTFAVTSLWGIVMIVGIVSLVFYIIGEFAAGSGSTPSEQMVYTVARGLNSAIKDAVNDLASRFSGG